MDVLWPRSYVPMSLIWIVINGRKGTACYTTTTHGKFTTTFFLTGMVWVSPIGTWVKQFALTSNTSVRDSLFGIVNIGNVFGTVNFTTDTAHSHTAVRWNGTSSLYLLLSKRFSTSAFKKGNQIMHEDNVSTHRVFRKKKSEPYSSNRVIAILAW